MGQAEVVFRGREWSRKEVSEATNLSGLPDGGLSAPACALDRRAEPHLYDCLLRVWIPNSTQQMHDVCFGPRWVAGGNYLY